MTTTNSRPQGIPYGESIVVDGDNVFLLIDRNWYVYSKRRAHLGDGGMGSVLMGRRLQDGMPVAIKRLHPEFNNRSNVRERIRLESSLTFSHPNLVETIGCCEGIGNDAPIFVVSKYILGQPIDQYVGNSFPDKRERAKHLVPIIKQLASALEFIHSKDIIHLDIKPSNILMERGSTVRLLDLGIAEVAKHRVLTHGYGLHGTPGYAAPEQYIDETRPKLEVDRRTDVYGLAATAFTLLTGHTPKMGETDRPEEGLGKNLHQTLIKGLDAKKESRYSSATEFSDAFEEAVKADAIPERDDKWLIIAILGSIATITAVILMILI